jgi:chromosome segregation ATPase
VNIGEGKPNVVLMAAAFGVLALGAAQIYTIGNLRAVETKLAQVQEEQAKSKDTISSEVQKVQDASAAATTAAITERERAIDAVRQQVEEARKQASGLAGQVKVEAMKGVQDLNSRLSASEQALKDARDTQARVVSEISGIKQTSAQAVTNIAAVSSEVRDVREEISATRKELNATIADLKRVNGDLGVLSGLIATNGKEIDALRQLGDRNYTEFTVRKSKEAIRVGDVWVLLKSTDERKSRYAIEIRIDDRRIEKKDRSLNEPVQFYVGRNRQPHEFVVNLIQKDTIVGYMATPKVAAAK